MKKIFAVAMLALFLAGSNVFADSDKTLATVNNEPIFSSDFNKILDPVLQQYKSAVPVNEQTAAREKEVKDSVLNQKIDMVVLSQEAKKQKIKVTTKEVQDVVNNQKTAMKLTDEQFYSELKKAGLTKAAYEKNIEEQLSIQKLAKQVVEPTIKQPSEADVRALYNKVAAKLQGKSTGLAPQEDALVSELANQIKRAFGAQIRISQIFVNAPKNAPSSDLSAAKSKIDVVKKELKNKPFGTVASQYSDDPQSKTRGGDMGFVSNGDLLPDLNKAVFALKLGEWTKEPVKTDAGYHFVRVDEQRAKRDVTFDAVKNDLAQVVYQQNARTAYDNYLKTLKGKSNISINKNW